jgi:hypothetical protein
MIESDQARHMVPLDQRLNFQVVDQRPDYANVTDAPGFPRLTNQDFLAVAPHHRTHWRRSMKLRSLFTTLAVGTAILVGSPAHAQAGDPCSVYTCMAGISGDGLTGGPACSAAYVTFFSMQVWDPYYDAGATASWRRGYMMACPGANFATNEGILQEIVDVWMWVP